MQNTKFKKILEIAVVIIFFSAFVLSLSKPIRDPDMFWHLKTGEWIWQNRSLPDKDPFSFTIEPHQNETSASASFTLKQYWLAQLIIYGFYQIGGFYGIVAFRCLIYLGIGLILYCWMGNIKNSSNSLSSSNSSKSSFKLSRMSRLIFLIPAVFASVEWLGERPNNLSFLFAVIVVYLLENLKKSSSSLNSYKSYSSYKSYKSFNYCNFLTYLPYCNLPLVMLLWANMHGGFILGNAIIILYMIAEIITNSFKRLNSLNRFKSSTTETTSPSSPFSPTFFIVCLIAILISFVNPNTYKVIYRIWGFASDKYSTISVTEHISPFYYASRGIYKYLIFICIMIAPFLFRIPARAGIHRFRIKCGMTDLIPRSSAAGQFNSTLLVVFLTVLSLKSVRFIPFLVFIATPFIAGIWGWFFDKALRKVERFYIPVILIFAFAIFLVLSHMRYSVFKSDIISPFYPAKAVRFIKAERPEGEIFNDFNFGGYLVWSLYPDYKVFMDGRRLFQSMELAYVKAHSGSAEEINGIPEWKAILNSYRVRTVLVPGINVVAGGGFTRLVRRLVEDNEWSLVFMDKEALLFIKDTGKNREIIKKYSRPKVLAYGKALEQAEFYRIRHPKDWEAYATLGEINLYLGRPKVALLYLESAFRLNPSLKSTTLNKLIEELKAGRDYSKLMDEIFR